MVDSDHSPIKESVRIFGRTVDKWALNFGVGSAFALLLLVAAIYFVNRLANAQERVVDATVEMKVLIAQSTVNDADRERRAETHYTEAARQYTETARRELDAIQRSEKLLAAIQAILDHTQAKPKPGGG